MDQSNQLGAALEEAVGKLFTNKGYLNVQLNRLMVGKSGARHEVDVYGEETVKKGWRRRTYSVAAECKHKIQGVKVEKKEVSDFIVKLHDLGIDRGYFVTTTSFTEDASNLASHYNVEKMDGRISNAQFREYGIDYYSRIYRLPVNIEGPGADAARVILDLAGKLGIFNAGQ